MSHHLFQIDFRDWMLDCANEEEKEFSATTTIIKRLIEEEAFVQ